MAIDQDIYSSVTTHYGNAARSKNDNVYSTKVATAFGYSPADLEGMPEEANLGLSCGNPIAFAGLREGEVVVDLGSGAGFDVFQAAKKVGPKGRAVGVDFNGDMLAKAESIKTKLGVGAENVDFIDSKITSIPAIEDGSVDVVISNCVINLVPEEEKGLVFREMWRVLKRGGRVAVSDILAKGEMSESVRGDMAAYVGCIAGASRVDEYEGWLRGAGFEDILIVDAKSDLNVYGETSGGDGPCCGPPASVEDKKTKCCGSKEETVTTRNTHGEAMAKFRDVNFNEFAGSYKIYVVKA